MGLDNEGFPHGSTPEEKQRIREGARDLAHQDRDLDDNKFTPPGLAGSNLEVSGIQPEGVHESQVMELGNIVMDLHSILAGREAVKASRLHDLGGKVFRITMEQVDL